MSYKAMSKLTEMATKVTTLTQYAVLAQLCDFYNDEKRIAWPSHETLMQRTGKSRASIKRAIHDLAKANLITYEIGIGRGNVTVYHLPSVDAFLDGKGFMDEPLLPEEKGSSVEIKGFTGEIKGFTGEPQNLLGNLLENQELTGDDAHAREAIPESAETPQKLRKKSAETPHQHVVDHAFDLWDLENLRIPGGKGSVIKDLAALLHRCKDNEDDAKGILSAFHAGMNGDRPHFAIVIDHVGRWISANRPTTYDYRNPPRIGGTNGRTRTTTYVNADRRADGSERFGGATAAADARTMQRLADRHRVPNVS